MVEYKKFTLNTRTYNVEIRGFCLTTYTIDYYIVNYIYSIQYCIYIIMRVYCISVKEQTVMQKADEGL